MTDFPKGKYCAILADPPWHYEVWSEDTGAGRSASLHYPTMSREEILALPVADVVADDCCLFLWVTWPCLLDGLAVIEAWGFEYKTLGFDWVKTNANNSGLAWGMGYYTRANPEPCLIATRGTPRRLNADVHSVIVAPRREHSRKPDEVHDRIERLMPGPYLELFGRQERPGWAVWGNEVGKFEPEPRQEVLALD